MDPDRLESLVARVLEETRAFRQEANEKFAAADKKIEGLRRDMKLVQTAVLDVAQDVKRVEAKLDKTIAEHGERLDNLEGTAAE